MDFFFILTILHILSLSYIIFFKSERNLTLIVPLSFLIIITFKVLSDSFFENFILLILSLYVFILAIYYFFSNRLMCYIHSIVFLITMPLLQMFGLNKISNMLGAAAFIVIIIGFTRDVLYEKFFE
jgi:hypothetical protein